MRNHRVVWTCDNCGKETEGEGVAKTWLSVSSGIFVLGEEPLCFCSKTCLAQWAMPAPVTTGGSTDE